MRKRLTLTAVIAVAAAVAVAATAAAVLTAPNGNTQTLKVKLSPKKLSKTKQTPVTLEVTTKTTSTTNANGVPVPAVQAIVDFDRQAKLFSKGYPTCTPGKIENTSTEAALAACKRAKIGGGKGTALIPIGSQVFVENTRIIAFNAKPQRGRPVVLLHTYGQAPVQVTLILVGVVTNYNKQGFGPRLTVTIPLLAGGTGALTDFYVKIRKTFTYKGKKRSYVSAKCKTKRLKARGKFVFKDGQSLTPKVSQRCGQKK